MCVCKRVSSVHAHTNEMIINDHETEPGQENNGLNLRQPFNEQKSNRQDFLL